MNILLIFELLASLGVLVIFVAVLLMFLLSKSYPDLGRYEDEKYFFNPVNSKKEVLPSIHDAPTVKLSVIVPSYNEAERLPKMLDETLKFLEDRLQHDSKSTYEIIVVDDGSNDKTSKVALKYAEKYGIEKLRVLTLVKNRGKGGAVRLGMLSSRGEWLLFADADGATFFPDLVKLESAMANTVSESGMGVVCGSRAHLEHEAVAHRSFFRTVLMYGFHFLVWFLCVKGIRDTQCGFKLLTRSSAVLLFSNLHVERWAFDVDLLYLAQYFNIPISEVAVKWEEIEDGKTVQYCNLDSSWSIHCSKMIPLFSWIQMGKDLLLIRLRYIIGAWKINPKIKTE